MEDCGHAVEDHHGLNDHGGGAEDFDIHTQQGTHDLQQVITAQTVFTLAGHGAHITDAQADDEADDGARQRDQQRGPGALQEQTAVGLDKEQDPFKEAGLRSWQFNQTFRVIM